MYFTKKKIKSLLASILFSTYMFCLAPAFANNIYDQMDSIRAELSFQKDKNSPNYIKLKQKLDRLIQQNRIDCSEESKLEDINRLINEQKYNAAIWELNNLIENGRYVSFAYMLLGDISAKTNKSPKKTASYYKLSIQNDCDNDEALYKLAKLYLKENKNILGIEYLNQAVEKTQNTAMLQEIEFLLQNKIEPQTRFDANNMYEILGKIYQKTDRKEDSYRAFNRALQLNSEDIFLKYYLADLYLCDYQNENAALVYESILKENPNDSMIRTSKAKALANDGNILSADREFRAILSKNPNSIQAKYGLYKLYERKLPTDKILEKIYADKKDYKADKKEYLAFAEILDKMNDSKGAENFRRYVTKLDEIEAQKRIAAQKQIEAQKLAAQRKAEAEKIAAQKKLEAQNKRIEEQKRIEAQKIEAQRLAKQKEQEKIKAQKLAAQKKAEAEKIAAQKKAEAEKLRQQQLLENKKAQEEKARQEKLREQKLLEEKKQKEYEQRAIAQERARAIKKDSKKYNEYKAVVDKYMKINPKDAATYIAIANTYKLMGEPTSALGFYKEAQKLNPTNSDIYYNLGLTYMELNSFVTAKANLIKAINLDKENTKAIKLLAFINQKIITNTVNTAYGEFEKKNYLRASEILDEGIKNYPKNAQLYYYRALVYDAMNRNAAQIIDLQKAIDFDPGYYMAYYQLGHAYEKINDEKSALVAYEKFLSTEPEEKDLTAEIQKKVITLGQKYY